MGTSTVFKEAAKASEAMSQLTKATTTGKKRKAAAEEDDTANAKPNKGRGKGKGKGKSKKAAESESIQEEGWFCSRNGHFAGRVVFCLLMGVAQGGLG